MKPIYKLAGVALIAMMAAVPAYRALAQAAPAAPIPTHMAVVNIVKVFSQLDEKKDGDKEIEDLANQIAKDRKKKEDNLNALNDGLKENGPYKPGSPDYKRQQDEVLQAGMDLQVFLAVSEQRLLMMQRLKTEAVYRSMNLAIQKYAEAHAIAIVFVTDEADFSNSKDITTLQSRIAMRKIVYAHPSYDITKGIIEQMNTDYKPAPK